jgi:hypothetical protein
MAEGLELTTTDPGEGGSKKLVGMFDMRPKSLTEAMEFSKLMAKSQLVPDQYKDKPQDILIAVQMGAELGLSPLQSVNSIAVINGRPTMWGDAVLAVVQRANVLDPNFGNGGIVELQPDEAKEKGYGECEIKRKGWEKTLLRRFTREMAEKAGLYERSKGRGRGDGPWITYEGRMLQMRARSWALRDGCADVLKGLRVGEEEQDWVTVGRTQEGHELSIPRARVQAGQVDEFLQESTRNGERRSVANGGGGRTQISQGASESQVWTGTLESIPFKDGTTKSGRNKGKPYRKYTVKGSGGFEATTFDRDLIEGLKEKGIGKGSEVEIEWSTDKYGKKVESIEPHIPETAETENGGEGDGLFDPPPAEKEK